jgi:hypothetical protein
LARGFPAPRPTPARALCRSHNPARSCDPRAGCRFARSRTSSGRPLSRSWPGRIAEGRRWARRSSARPPKGATNGGVRLTAPSGQTGSRNPLGSMPARTRLRVCDLGERRDPLFAKCTSRATPRSPQTSPDRSAGDGERNRLGRSVGCARQASAGMPDSSGVVHACVLNATKTIRLIDTAQPNRADWPLHVAWDGSRGTSKDRAAPLGRRPMPDLLGLRARNAGRTS